MHLSIRITGDTLRACRQIFLFLSIVLTGAALGPFQAQAHADEVAPIDDSRFTFGGFGTLGVARSSNGNADILRTIAQPEGISNNWSGKNDSILGLQAGYRFTDSVEAVVQAVSHLRDDGSYSPQVTWAFLKYDVTPRLSFRLGRVGTEFLMHSDSRFVGYAYLPVRPAIDFYGIVPFNGADGLDARLRWPLGDGTLRLEAFAGKTTENIPPYDLEDSRILKGSVGYDQDAWQFRYIYANASFANNMDQIAPLRSALAMLGATTAADDLALKDTLTHYHSLGAVYDDGTWQAQAAVNYLRHESHLMENSRAATFMVARRFGDVSPFIGYTWVKSKKKSVESGLPDPMFAPINSALAQATSLAHLDRQTYSLGARWDFARNVDLKAQIDFVRGKKSSTLMLTDIEPDWNGRTTVFSLSLDFVF